MNRRRNGFTLIEALIAVVILGAVVAMLYPVIAGVWSKSRDFVDINNMRATYADFRSWGVDRQDSIPNAGGPFQTTVASRGYYGVLHNDDQGWGLYILQNELWPNLLRQQYNGQVQRYWHSSYAHLTQDDLNHGSMAISSPDGDGPQSTSPNRSAPGNNAPPPGVIEEMSIDDLIVETAMDYRAGAISHLQTEYRLGLTLLTDASVWTNPGAVTSTRWVRNHAREVRFNEVANPSRKGLLYHNDWPRADEGFHHVAFTDGSVSLKNWADAEPTAVSPFDTTGVPGDPVNATFNGYRGIDF